MRGLGDFLKGARSFLRCLDLCLGSLVSSNMNVAALENRLEGDIMRAVDIAAGLDEPIILVGAEYLVVEGGQPNHCP